MARPLKGADHSKGKLDHLINCVTRPDFIPNHFYKGQSCVHGHELRHKMHHWCLHCAVKIVKNNCSANINEIDMSHYSYYTPIFVNLPVPTDASKCWIMPNGRLPSNHQRPKYSALTYRSPFINRAESIFLSRFVYFLFWGDVGTLTVKRLCKNSCCWNPFHLKTVFNISPFVPDTFSFVNTSDLDTLKAYNKKISQKDFNQVTDLDPSIFI
jgi:hypothetical protein